MHAPLAPSSTSLPSPRKKSSPSIKSKPTALSASCWFGLTKEGSALSDAFRTVGEASTTVYRPSSLALRNRPTRKLSSRFAGRLPAKTIAVAYSMRNERRPVNSWTSSGETAGPCSLISVCVPVVGSTIAVDVRLGLRISTKSKGMAASLKPSRMVSPLRPPTSPVASTGTSRALRARATFMPLPPASATLSVARCLWPSVRLGTTRVRSTAALRVTVRITCKHLPLSPEPLPKVLPLYTTTSRRRPPILPSPQRAFRRSGRRDKVFAERYNGRRHAYRAPPLEPPMKRLLVVALLVLFGAVGYRVYGSPETGTGSLTLPQPAPSIGEEAPNFESERRDGNRFELSGEGVYVLTFWSTLNKDTSEARPEFEQMARDYENEGVSFAAIYVSNAPEDEEDTPYAVLQDGAGALTAMYNVKTVPRLFLIQDGTIELVLNGHYPQNEELLRGVVPSPVTPGPPQQPDPRASGGPRPWRRFCNRPRSLPAP